MQSNRVARPTILGILVLFASGLAGCGGPFVMIPGGQLSGPVLSAPSSWSFTDEVDTIQIETRPADPYSVNVWGTASGSDLYIACGDPTSQWCENLRANSTARVRIGEAIYRGSARLVEDPATRERVLVDMKKKYDFEPSPEDKTRAELFVFRAE